jgi:glycosyltransferase involved in cell wall biosynthesis
VEHIVIDGASSDQTLDILGEFEGKYNLKWISEPDSGIANALNKGLRLAKGQHIIVLQADDQFAGPEILEIVYPLLREVQYDIHSFPVIRHEPSNRKTLYKPIKILFWYHFKTIFPHQGAFVHRRVYDRIGNFREDLTIALDYDFFYRALKSRCEVKFHKYPVAIMGATGISSNRDFLLQRLKEEAYVQNRNEADPTWKLIQLLFQKLYVPYKTRFIPYWHAHSKPGGAA